MDPDSRVIHVVVKCEEDVAEALHAEWSNVLPLLRRTYSDWQLQLRRAAGKLVWGLHPNENHYPDVTAFINDLFLTERLREIRERNEVQVEVPVSTLTAGE